MEAVIAEGPLDCGFTVFTRAEVSFEGRRAVVIMHTVLDHEWLAPSTTDPILLQKRELLPRTLEIRREYLMRYVQQEVSAALENKTVSDSRVADALSAAFHRMNRKITKREPDVRTLPDASWLSQYNSMVMVFDGARVFVAGDAASQAMLVRKGEMKKLTRSCPPVSVHGRLRGIEGAPTPLCFFNRETLTKDDKYLVIYSAEVTGNVEERDLPVALQARAKYFGLETACAQIVDSNWHQPPRLVVALPLDDVEDAAVAITGLQHYGVIGLIDESFAGLTVSCAVHKKPETEWHGSGFTSTRVVAHHRMVCKFMSSKLVISVGDISGWHVDGKNDAAILPANGIVDYQMQNTLASRVISDVWQWDLEGLASCYRAAADRAECEGVKYIAFPGVGCGNCSLPEKEAASIGVRTMVKCGGKFEEVHFVLPNEKAWSAWVAATDLLSYLDRVDLKKRWREKVNFK